MKKVTASEIRRFVIARLDSFRCGDQWVIRSGKVAQMMGYSGSMRNTCQVLRGDKFLRATTLKLIGQTYPDDSTTTTFTYKRAGSTQAVPAGADSSTDEAGEQVDAKLETEVRQQVIESLDELAPLRRIIRAGEVADSTGLEGRMAEVCSAIAGRRFQEDAHLDLEDAIFQHIPDPARGATETDPDLSSDNDPTGPATECVESSGPDACDSGVEPGPDATDSAKDLPAVDLCLVSCVKGKRSSAAPAKDLYISDWFKKARRIVETEGWRWFVLSAKHGLLDPEELIAPYEKTLDTMGAEERRSWANEVWEALDPHLSGVRSIVVFAGQKYREHLEPRLREVGIEVRVPMEGLRRGDQLAWLKRRLDRQ